MTTLSRLVDHLIGMNRVFTALLADAPVPRASTGGQVNEDPVIAYHESAAALLRAFGQPGVLDRSTKGRWARLAARSGYKSGFTIFSRMAGI